jgi:hypothetical protein
MQPRFLVVPLVIMLQSSCNHTEPASAPKSIPMASSAQLEAALAIMNPIQRDEALDAVAKTAAASGDGSIAMSAVMAMANPAMKDETAVRSANTLAKAGKGTEATAMAKVIQNPIKRDEALLAISKL